MLLPKSTFNAKNHKIKVKYILSPKVWQTSGSFFWATRTRQWCQVKQPGVSGKPEQNNRDFFSKIFYEPKNLSGKKPKTTNQNWKRFPETNGKFENNSGYETGKIQCPEFKVNFSKVDQFLLWGFFKFITRKEPNSGNCRQIFSPNNYSEKIYA